MDIDFWAKLGALLIGAFSTFKLAHDWLGVRLGRSREEYKFAKEFLQDLDRSPGMHPFLKEKGFQAIAGDSRLTSSEIEYLLTLHDSPKALKDYGLGRAYLQHFSTAGETQLDFKPKYSSRWSRLWRKAVYLTLYSLFFFAAFAPLLLPSFRAATPGQSLFIFTLSSVLLIPPAFLVLRAGVRIARAEALVKNQIKHSGAVVVVARASSRLSQKF